MLRFALRIISGKIIYNFAILENLRIFQNCLFTGGVVTANGICSTAFCESAALREASSPSQSPTVTALPKGEVASRSDDGEGEDACGGRTLSGSLRSPAPPKGELYWH